MRSPSPDNRKSIARRRRNALENVRKVWQSGSLDRRELRRLVGEIVHRYAL